MTRDSASTARPLTELTEPQRGHAMARFAFLRRHVEDGVPSPGWPARKASPFEQRAAGCRGTDRPDSAD